MKRKSRNMYIKQTEAVREQNLAMNSSDEEILDANRKDLRD
jgi:hypothetical protein